MFYSIYILHSVGRGVWTPGVPLVTLSCSLLRIAVAMTIIIINIIIIVIVNTD